MPTTTRDLYVRSMDTFGDLLDNVSDEQRGSCTPCSDWNVRQLTEHVVNAQRHLVFLLTGAMPSPPARSAIDPDSDPIASWHEACRGVRAALSEANDADNVTTPMGAKTVSDVLGIVIIEPFIHGWDLAIATGQHLDLDAETVASLLPRVEELGDQLQQTGMYEQPPSTNGVSPSDRLLALLGRHA
jgi:uncharacterized protein (TIGR03086 family)